MRLNFKSTHMTFDPRFMDKVRRIDLHVVHSEFIYFDLFMQKRKQLNICHNLMNVSNRIFYLRKRIVLAYSLYAFYAQVQREFKLYTFNGDFHFHLL